MNNIAPQLITERLILNDIEERDALLIVKWRSNPDIYKYFLSPHPLRFDEHMKWFYQKYLLDTNCFNWMAVAKCSMERIGVFGVKRQKDDKISAEISYILAKEYQGKGYAREAVEKLIEFAKKDWRCTEAVAEIHIENKESLRFARGLGFNYAGKNGNFALYKRML